MFNKFIIVVPVYNGEKWIEHCLDSIMTQDYSNFDVIVIDDCSDDNTWDLIKGFDCKRIRNDKRNGSALENIIKGIKWLSDGPMDIIVTVDGDDYLADKTVLTYLNEVYQGDIWLTYGSFLPLSGRFKNTCQNLAKAKTPCKEGYLVEVSLTPQTYRKSGLWFTSHLRTFRRWLWDKIDDKDLRDEGGEYFKVAWDLAFMYPMIEMAGRHIKFIDRILYMYNDLNPFCDGIIRTEEQLRTTEYIQNKEVYGELDSNIL